MKLILKMKRYFRLIFIGDVILTGVSIVLTLLFSDKTSFFTVSFALFFMSIIERLAVRNASKPSDRFSAGMNDSMMFFWSIRGKIPEYIKLCEKLFLIGNIGGCVFLLLGLFEILLR